jgi:hypothetical protein
MQLPPNVSPVSASFFGHMRQGIHLVLCVACSSSVLGSAWKFPSSRFLLCPLCEQVFSFLRECDPLFQLLQRTVVSQQQSLSKIEDLYLKLFKVRVLSNDTEMSRLTTGEWKTAPRLDRADTQEVY